VSVTVSGDGEQQIKERGRGSGELQLREPSPFAPRGAVAYPRIEQEKKSARVNVGGGANVGSTTGGGKL
jgi:hypothetical protein